MKTTAKAFQFKLSGIKSICNHQTSSAKKLLRLRLKAKNGQRNNSKFFCADAFKAEELWWNLEGYKNLSPWWDASLLAAQALTSRYLESSLLKLRSNSRADPVVSFLVVAFYTNSKRFQWYSEGGIHDSCDVVFSSTIHQDRRLMTFRWKLRRGNKQIRSNNYKVGEN